jgi:hypothetical protein
MLQVLGQLAQLRVLRAAADQQHAQVGHARRQLRHRAQQHVQAFVRVERADEADQARLAGQAQLVPSAARPRMPPNAELVDVDRVRESP